MLSGGITAVLDVHAKYTGEVARKNKINKKSRVSDPYPDTHGSALI